MLMEGQLHTNFLIPLILRDKPHFFNWLLAPVEPL